jgi:hypothetical protein
LLTNGFMHVLVSRFGKRIIFLALSAAMLIGIGHTAPAIAQNATPAPHKAGLVVVHEDGAVASRCVGFDEESISGYELLVRGGFAPRAEVTAMGMSVCSLDGQGCGAGSDCFCQCKSSTCRYWTYWRRLPEGWRYSNAGAGNVQVHDGDVQGWVWGDSKPNASAQNAPSSSLTFAAICSPNAPIFGVAITQTLPTQSAEASAASTTQPWLVAGVVAIPFLLAGAWWLWQRRRAVQA